MAGRKEAAETVEYWHFVAEGGREQWGSRRKIEVGKTYKVKGDIALGQRGLHASERALDALAYAQGALACKVRLSGRILHDIGKSVATERTVVAMADATTILHEFAVWCAQRALLAEHKAGREPDKRSWEALRVKRRWIRGKATNSELAAAKDGALAAASDAAKDVTGEEAFAKAWIMVRAAAEEAWVAAKGGSRGAAMDTPRDALNQKLEQMLSVILPPGQ